jgi:hypothetical protein
MNMNAFISHSSKDKVKADELVAHIESEDLNCWIAPRNIPPSASYAKEIVKGIDSCEFFILLLSENSNSSDAVAGEVEMAFNRGKPIIPVRLGEVSAGASIELFISRSQWVDALNQSQFALAKKKLVHVLRNESISIDEPIAQGIKNRLVKRGVVSLILLLIVFSTYDYYSESLKKKEIIRSNNKGVDAGLISSKYPSPLNTQLEIAKLRLDNFNDTLNKDEINKLKNDKNHAQISIGNALMLNDIAKLRYFYENGVPFDVLEKPYRTNHLNKTPYFVDALAEAKPDALDFILSKGLISLTKTYNVEFDIRLHPQILSKAGESFKWIKESLENQKYPPTYIKNNIHTIRGLKLTDSFIEEIKLSFISDKELEVLGLTEPPKLDRQARKADLAKALDSYIEESKLSLSNEGARLAERHKLENQAFRNNYSLMQDLLMIPKEPVPLHSDSTFNGTILAYIKELNNNENIMPLISKYSDGTTLNFEIQIDKKIILNYM